MSGDRKSRSIHKFTWHLWAVANVLAITEKRIDVSYELGRTPATSATTGHPMWQPSLPMARRTRHAPYARQPTTITTTRGYSVRRTPIVFASHLFDIFCHSPSQLFTLALVRRIGCYLCTLERLVYRLTYKRRFVNGNALRGVGKEIVHLPAKGPRLLASATPTMSPTRHHAPQDRLDLPVASRCREYHWMCRTPSNWQ